MNTPRLVTGQDRANYPYQALPRIHAPHRRSGSCQPQVAVVIPALGFFLEGIIMALRTAFMIASFHRVVCFSRQDDCIPPQEKLPEFHAGRSSCRSGQSVQKKIVL